MKVYDICKAASLYKRRRKAEDYLIDEFDKLLSVEKIKYWSITPKDFGFFVKVLLNDFYGFVFFNVDIKKHTVSRVLDF